MDCCWGCKHESKPFSSMASRKLLFGSKPSYIYPADDGNDVIINQNDVFEFDEADVWNNNNSNEPTTNIEEGKKPLPSLRAWSKKLSRKMESHKTPKMAVPASLPVNIPDWSKILKAENREHGCEDDEDGGDGEGRVPPHEYLARRRGASFSVQEGIGRTLKGRDLRCVRNAVWKKTGFED
ncbi:hypothetical protein ERO13_A04G074300v2 [Gossypium hirsutum]|nr:hypothetical protein ERO13_A04G074300v2 [Gossypium hirsutum]TYH22161.1 hypothetical protein ES288_A04G104700v1 [Gossypium darwinii]TYI33049.1 hypothetical protein ES332_A04G105200v1 [Gossypium tomentosum]